MVSQPDLAVILEAGHADLFIYSLLFSLSLERSSSIHLVQPAASGHRTGYLWALATLTAGFLLQNGQLHCPELGSVTPGQGSISAPRKSWPWKRTGEPSATYKTRRFFRPAKSILVILVILFRSRSLQWRANSGQIFFRLNVWFIQPRLAWTRGTFLVKEKAIPMINDIPGACPTHGKDTVRNKPFIMHVEELCYV